MHLRLNEKDSRPNDRINFISILPFGKEEDVALQLLKALAAQVKPLMKSLGLEINSLEEYEYNRVFAGRNWNNGETVELVLRQPNGHFFPFASLLGVLIHELAHIRHMNHGPQFWKFNNEMKAEVQALRRRGYYGDGFWSSGHSLGGALVRGESQLFQTRPLDFPEYTCGGAQEKPKRPLQRKRRRRAAGRARSAAGASSSRPTLKAGTRVRRRDAFQGQAQVLVQDADERTKSGGFRKSTKTKRATNAAADAAERRLAKREEPSRLIEGDDDDDDDDGDLTESTEDEYDWSNPHEDDSSRSHAQNKMGEDELAQLRDEFKKESKDWAAESLDRPPPRPCTETAVSKPSSTWTCQICTQHELGDGVNPTSQSRCYLCESLRP